MEKNARNEVRVSDADPEMLAIKAVGMALAPLDEQAGIRVLKWADARFGQGASLTRETKIHEILMKHLDTISEGMRKFETAARDLGINNAPLVLSAVVDRIYREAVAEMERERGGASSAA